MADYGGLHVHGAPPSAQLVAANSVMKGGLLLLSSFPQLDAPGLKLSLPCVCIEGNAA